MAGPLGRNTPPDWKHVEKYPLKELGDFAPQNVPVVLGVNWYTSFDNPKSMASAAEGTSYHVPDVEKGEKLGSVRGGHCFCLEPMGAVKLNKESLRRFYNQGEVGACEGFGHSRAQSILRGLVTFDAFWLYNEARKYEHNEGEGSTNRSTCAVLQTVGLRTQDGEEANDNLENSGPVDPKLGISKYRWATTAEEVCAALGRPNAQAVPFQNSWGDGYQDVVWLPVATLQRLLDEEGEADIVTDR